MWIGLITLILVLLIFDLLVLNRKGKVITNKRAAIETLFWVLVAASFSMVVLWVYHTSLVPNVTHLKPAEAVIKYITGYLIELSLSVDNLFVIAVIFTSFNIPMKHQHKALFWGILGAIVLRGLMISLGVILINKVSWMTYIFGAFLLFTAFKLLFRKEDDSETKQASKIYRYLKISHTLDGDKFWTIENGVKMFTPLFAALVIIEFTDLLFALDSIPAILAVTTDPFIVFSSNIFAILGLRSMYFFLAHMLQKFHYLKYSVFVILFFVAIKLLVIHYIEFPEWFSLAFIGTSLGVGIWVSFAKKN